MYDLKFTPGGFLDFINDMINFRTNEIGAVPVSLKFWASTLYFVGLLKPHLNLVSLISSCYFLCPNHFGLSYMEFICLLRHPTYSETSSSLETVLRVGELLAKARVEV